MKPSDRQKTGRAVFLIQRNMVYGCTPDGNVGRMVFESPGFDCEGTPYDGKQALPYGGLQNTAH